MKSIVLIGMAGCGKSTIGKYVARRLCRPFIDVDKAIEKHFGPIPKLFEPGEANFRQCETQAVEEACQEPGAVIATGGGVITQSINMEMLKKAGSIFFIDRPIDRIVRDIDVSTRPLFICGIEALNTAYHTRLPLYRQYADYVVANDGGIQDAVQKIIDIVLEGKL
jgi:shikimate kinase